MLKSMTGFGSAQLDKEDCSIHIEIKTVNSKYFDASLRLSSVFSDKEIEIKNLASKILERGKVYINIQYTPKGKALVQPTVNSELVSAYYQSLITIADRLGAPRNSLFELAMQIPDAMRLETDEESLTQHWLYMVETLKEALSDCDTFRKDEGAALTDKFASYIAEIADYLQKIMALDAERLAHVRQRLHKQIADFTSHEKFDENRFEQELIYYIEKLDIEEEKVRLQRHLDYFLENLHSEKGSGRKLNFIAQEIGREINTIGSKANYAPMQHLVVEMKETLDKIKEQVLNIL
ncbi:MAG: YicC family protein [Bernardetiaceae bacterium]|nr:YicC family protein [Bernardetiaceae bacterium]